MTPDEKAAFEKLLKDFADLQRKHELHKHLGQTEGTQKLSGSQSVRTHQNAVTALTQNAWTSLTFQVDDTDDYNLHDVSTNNTRITITVGGIYVIGGQFMPQSIFTELGEALQILLNGATVLSQNVMTGDSGTAILAITNNTTQIITLAKLAAGDYIELQAATNFGGALNTSGDANTHFWATKLV